VGLIPWETWTAFMVATVALVAVPGPTVLLVSAQSAAHGFASGLRMIAGVAFANILQIIVVALGLTALLSAFPATFASVRIAGAAYLFWIGLSHWREQGSRGGTTPARQGFIVTILNPKSILAIAALFPPFINPDGSSGPQFLVLGATFLLFGFIVVALYAAAAGALGERIRITRRLSGLALMATAVFIVAI